MLFLQTKRKTLLINVSFILACILAYLSYEGLVSNFLDKNKHLEHRPAYYLLSSELFAKEASLTLLSRNNVVLEREKLALQDVEQVAVESDRIIFAGTRANNLLEITSNEKKQFYLLDETHYTGVTTITYTKNYLLAVMNGNMTENGYKSLLVVQNLDGKLIKKIDIPLFASKIIATDKNAYVAGASIDVAGRFSPSIVKINLDTYSTQSYIGEKDHKYNDILICQNKLYCLQSDMYEKQAVILQHDVNSLKRTEHYHFEKAIDTIYTYRGQLYALCATKIYAVKQGKIENIVHELEDFGYYQEKCQIDEHLYILRQLEKQEEKPDDYIGQIVDISLRYGSKVTTNFRLENQATRILRFAPVPKATKNE